MFPWQQKQWQQLLRLKQENCLPHALLLTGIAGTGKAIFADSFSRLLLCQNNNCNTCHHCRLIAGRAHPNVLWIEPEKPGHAIKVDQIRYVNEFINQSGLQGDYRLVIIHPANAMNANAANALLKTLEEPSANAILMLISDQSQRLPATIISRCQRMLFPPPKQEEALAWLKQQPIDAAIDLELLLKLANGAPLAAMKLMKDDLLSQRQALFQQGDPIKLAAKMQEMDLLQLIDFILSWVMDLLRLQVGDDGSRIINQDYKKQLMQAAQQTELSSSTKFIDYLQQLRGEINRGINLNKQLTIENILIKWIGCTNVSR
ncbi:MAG: DNA polymerase III subunit delta' [Gammaproteobacteria bacterium]|nr:MAG: DNA polymerase III subunit delta' [Gammaproteobacteria bacterium]